MLEAIMKTLTCSLFVLMGLTYVSCSPSVIHKCWLWDPSCLTSKAQAIVPTLAAGIPALGVERLDTMFIDSLHIDQDGLKTDWKNIYIQGLRNTIIDKVSVDMNSKIIRVVFHSDILLKSHYILGGYLFSLPIFGEGEVTMKLDKTQMEFVIPFDIIKDIYGKDTIKLKGYHYWYDIKNGTSVFFDNLYYGNNELSKKMHLLLHQHWKQLTTKFGRYLFDKSNDKIFNAVRAYLHAQPLDTILFH